MKTPMYALVTVAENLVVMSFPSQNSFWLYQGTKSMQGAPVKKSPEENGWEPMDKIRSRAEKQIGQHLYWKSVGEGEVS